MTPRRSKVLVLTRDIALSLGLAQVRDDCEADEGHAVPRPSGRTLVVDLSTVDLDFDELAAENLQPDVVLVDELSAIPVDDFVEVLQRPCTVEELSEAIDRAQDRERRQSSVGSQAGPASADNSTRSGGESDDLIDLVHEEETAPSPKGGVESAYPPSRPPSRAAATDGVGPRTTRDQAPRAAAPLASTEVDRTEFFDTEQPLSARVHQAVRSTDLLLAVLEDFPMLGSLPQLRDTIVSETADAFHADAVALWEPDERGYRATASHGIIGHEGLRVVSATHPLLLDVAQPGGGLLLDPTSAVPAAVAGIAGAHTTSLMAASLGHVGDGYGVITVGRGRSLREADLDQLSDFAAEAGVMLIAAKQLQRLTEYIRPAARGATPVAPA